MFPRVLLLSLLINIEFHAWLDQSCKRYVSNGNVEATPQHLNGRPKLTPPDVNVIEFVKNESPTMTGKEIKDKIKRYFPVSGTYLFKIVLVI